MVSRAELMAEAKDLGIKGRSKMKKTELEEAIRRAKEMGEEATETKTSEKKAPKMPEARVAPKMAEARQAPKQMPPKQIEAKKADMMRVQTANKRARGY